MSLFTVFAMMLWNVGIDLTPYLYVYRWSKKPDTPVMISVVIMDPRH